MKKLCAGLAVVLVSLVAISIAAATDFHGVLNPNGFQMTADSVRVSPHDTTFITANWGGTVVDTFNFPDLVNWPTTVVLYGHMPLGPNTTTIPNPISLHWYNVSSGGTHTPLVMFYGAGGVEESKPTVELRPCLNVNPSVVTTQMMVSVRPSGQAKPVVEVLNATGNLIRSLNCTSGANGLATATWNRADGSGHLVPRGVYFCRYAASGAVAVRKVLVAH